MGEAQGLWAWVASVHRGLAVTRRNLSVVLGMLDMRLRAVRVIFVMAVSEELLEAVARHWGLRVRHLEGTDSAGVDSRLLMMAVSKLEDVNMRKSRMDFWQAEEIWKAVGMNSTLKKLNI